MIETPAPTGKGPVAARCAVLIVDDDREIGRASCRERV